MKECIVELEEFKGALSLIKRINNASLEDIMIKDNGQILKLDESAIKEFKFTGLNNKDFITYYIVNRPTEEDVSGVS